MSLQFIICISLIVCSLCQTIYCLPLFTNYQNDPGIEQSLLGNLLRYKAQFVDEIANNIQQTFQDGFNALSNNINNFGNSFTSLIGMTNRLIDDGVAAGKQYGSTIFQGIMIVPKSIADLVLASRQNDAFINHNTAQSLSYINGKPHYLFQFIDNDGRIIPITAAVANKLVPNLNI